MSVCLRDYTGVLGVVTHTMHDLATQYVFCLSRAIRGIRNALLPSMWQCWRHINILLLLSSLDFPSVLLPFPYFILIDTCYTAACPTLLYKNVQVLSLSLSLSLSEVATAKEQGGGALIRTSVCNHLLDEVIFFCRIALSWGELWARSEGIMYAVP